MSHDRSTLRVVKEQRHLPDRASRSKMRFMIIVDTFYYLRYSRSADAGEVLAQHANAKSSDAPTNPLR
jgi:hypothetical protein